MGIVRGKVGSSRFPWRTSRVRNTVKDVWGDLPKLDETLMVSIPILRGRQT